MHKISITGRRPACARTHSPLTAVVLVADINASGSSKAVNARPQRHCQRLTLLINRSICADLRGRRTFGARDNLVAAQDFA